VWLSNTVLIAVLGADLVLAVALVTRHSARTVSDVQVFDAVPETASPTPSASVSVAPPAPAAPRAVLAATAPDGAALRASTPSRCDATPPATVEISAGSGRSWTVVDSPAPVIVRVTLTSATDGWLIGSDSACRTYRYYGTTDGGRSWQPSADTAGYWYPLAGRAETVHTPIGNRDLPCPAGTTSVTLTPRSVPEAEATCVGPTTSRLLRTTDSGDTWTPVPQPRVRATAVTWPTPTAGFLAAEPDAQCSGIPVWRTTDGQRWSRVGCGSIAGLAALSFSDERAGVMVVAGSVGLRTLLTADGGRTWRPAV
jgi:hypothetical protein